MRERVKSAIKRRIVGTRAEPVARKLWYAATRRRPADGLTLESERKNRLYDEMTLEIMGRILSPDSNCLDIGAHGGSLLKEMVERSPAGTHYAFEPLPAYAAQLREQFPGVHVMEMALADEAGQADFRHVLGAPAFSGFVRRPYDTYEERVEHITVRVERLDDVVPADLRVRFVKVDVEGAESRVFRGGLSLLSTQKPFMAFEVGLYPEAVHEAVVDRAGLQISLLEDWLAGREPLDREAFLGNCFGGHHWFYFAHPPRP